MITKRNFIKTIGALVGGIFISPKATLAALKPVEKAPLKVTTIAEILNNERGFLPSTPWVESNDVFSNLKTRRSSVPLGTWRKLNE